ncbi:uncharacterized protein itprid1 [Notolabrus celidotus]|uniref:uncharacterized protein itprid1 n=1 Tax=Notolabrus celidotus TaxID=1203425 RepID=UPI0014903824|nr:uncharacterized protein itprid1 [Notolabrus celidotus]
MGSHSMDGVRKWLSTTVTGEDAKHEPLLKASEPLRRNTSCDDDLALGVEASLYDHQGVRTVQDFLRWRRSSPGISRLNSFNSTASDHSGPLSVMDILNLWNDDPEEVLLDLGFGCDEPDLSGRIPARFINYPSQARGINLQVFLEAQKNRLDLENPDVSNRFRQLEVLQQVTTAFSSLVGSSSPHRAPQADLPPEARERRRRMGMLFRRASKKTLSNIRNHKNQDPSLPCIAPQSHLPPSSLGDNRIPFKKVKTGLLETTSLSPLAEEQGPGSDAQPQSHDGELRSWPLREARSLKMNSFLQRRKNAGQARESFEMEEIHSFDEGSVTGSFMGGADNLVRCLVRTTSCQSDSSGFLEEPFIPPHSQQESPAPDLIKALSCLSGGSTESHSGDRPGSPFPPHTSQPLLHHASLTPSSVDNPSVPSTYPPRDQSPGLPQSPASSCLPKSDLKVSGTETPPDQDRSPEYEYLCPCTSSPELVNTNERSETGPPSASVTSVLLIRASEEIQPEDMDSPPCDSDPTAYSIFHSEPLSASSTHPNLDCTLSSTVSFFGGPEETHSEETEESPYMNSLSPSNGPSSQLPSHLFSPSSSLSDSYLPSPEAPSSQSPEKNQKDSLLQDSSREGLFDPLTCAQTKEEKEEEEKAHPSVFFESEQDRPLALSALTQDSLQIGEFAPDPGLSPNPSTPICESTSLLESHDQDGLTDPAAGGVLDATEQSIFQPVRPYSNDHITDFPFQEVLPLQTDDFSLDLEDNQGDGKGDMEAARHPEPVQTLEASVYISDTEGSAGLSGSGLVRRKACNQKGTDPKVSACCLHHELSTETKAEDLRKVSQMDIRDTESESWRTSLASYENVPGAHSRNEREPKGLFEIQSLDVVFQTSVDGSDGENGDMDAFLEQLDTERHVYWAEPITVSSQSSVVEESSSFETSGGPPGKSLPTTGPAILDSLSSTGRTDPVPATPDPKPFSRSVSVQMSSSPSSHIVHRKDVPYMTDSKRILFPADLSLDTSTPFRAVQSWTDWQIQRNNLSKMLSRGAPDEVKNQRTGSTEFSETTRRPALIYSSSPCLPLLSKAWRSYDSLPGMARGNSTASVSVDKGLWSDEEEEVEKNGYEDERNLWQAKHADTIACCCSCDHQGTSCYNTQHTVGNTPYSLDELEEMMLSLQQFRSVLCNMEEQLSEDQAAVYSCLSDQDREKVRDIEELRRAVKKEAGELEMQLNELAHHYDDSLKMKMHRLLDEQSLLCTQLRVPLPGQMPTSLCPAPNRTVATQCCLLPWMQNDQVSSWNVDSPRQSPPGSDSISEGLGCSPTKADKVDLLSFLQRLKESLRHSVNMDMLE